MKRTASIILTKLLILAVSVSVAAGAVELSIKDNVEVSGDAVTIGEIASVRGGGPDVESLKLMKLGSSPVPGTYRILKRLKVISFLSANGWSDVVIKSPDKIKVWRKSQTLSREYIAGEVEKFLIAGMPWAREKAEVQVRVSRDNLTLPAGAVSLKVHLSDDFSFLGDEMISLTLLLDGTPAKTLWARSDIRIYRDMVVASRPILKNEILKEEDLVLKKRLLSSVRPGIHDNLSDLVGMRARRLIKKGDLLVTVLVSEHAGLREPQARVETDRRLVVGMGLGTDLARPVFLCAADASLHQSRANTPAPVVWMHTEADQPPPARLSVGCATTRSASKIVPFWSIKVRKCLYHEDKNSTN